MIIHVETLEDKRLEAYVGLTEVQLRNRLEPEKGIFIAESEKVIVRALDAGYEPLSLLIPEHRLQRSARLIERIETQYALEEKAGAGGSAVVRNAAALGFDALIISPGCCDPLYRRAIRVSMGTVFQVPWTRFPGTVEDWRESGVAALKHEGFTTVALALHDESVFLDDARLQRPEKLAVLLGTEGEGLQQRTIEMADLVAKIPMREGVDSLNVAAASAVAFWELRMR